MASGYRRPAGKPAEPRIPRGFDSTDPERQGEVAPPAHPAGESDEGPPRRAPEAHEEGGNRRR